MWCQLELTCKVRQGYIDPPHARGRIFYNSRGRAKHGGSRTRKCPPLLLLPRWNVSRYHNRMIPPKKIRRMDLRKQKMFSIA
mmetsp:Transcript_4569/g.6007  ORF Transcript_4569/g.6007 Transcript_4569/m.6007 type:complete len:82 (-) Transcript_4569:41-286(-)